MYALTGGASIGTLGAVVELPADVEVIDSTRRYVLGLSGTGYGVWDRRAPGEPIQLFPENDEGYGQAERLFDELRALDVEARGMLARALRWGVFVGAAVWVASASIQITLVFVSSSPFEDTLFRFLQSLDSVAFRVAVGALGALAATALFRSERVAWSRSVEGEPGSHGGAGPPATKRPASVVALTWIFTGSALAWTVAGALTRGPFRVGPELLLNGEGPRLGAIVAAVVEVTSFRVAFATLAALAMMWAWPGLRPAPPWQPAAPPSGSAPAIPEDG
jgi:hypothetical protein